MKRRTAEALVLAGWAFARSLFTSRQTRLRPTPPRSVLIVQLAKLGDLICTTPMFRAIKQSYPDCRVTVLGRASNAAVLAGHPDVDAFLAFDGSSFPTISRLRREEFDFACLTAPDFIGLALLVLAGIPAIAAPKIENGFSPYETNAYRWLRSRVIATPHRMGSYAPREYLRLLEPLEIRTDATQKSLPVSPDASASVDRLLASEGVDAKKDFLVGIAPSVGNRIKTWAPEKFGAVANHLNRTVKAVCVITGGPTDAETCQAMLNSLEPTVRAINTCGRLTIEELKALVKKLRVFIGVDTGVIYIAEALGTPTVDIVGPMDEREQPPRGKFHRVVVPASRVAPALHIMNVQSIDRAEARRQIDSITVDQVVSEVDDLLASLTPPSHHDRY